MIDTQRAPFSLKEKVLSRFQASKVDFWGYLQKMKETLKQQMEMESDQLRINILNDKALKGDPEAVAYYMNEIERYLRVHPYSGSIPNAYDNVVQALFQEWIGFGPAYKWLTHQQYAASSGLQIIGRNMFYAKDGAFIPFPYKMHSIDRTAQLLRALLKNDPTVKLDRDHPSAEFKMDDPLWPGRFIRIAVWNEPRVWDDFTTISFRRQVVEYLSLLQQAGTKSIPYEAVPMLANLVLTYRNTIIAGPVGSGKTTLANTIVGEQIKGSTKTLGVIMIEKHPESILPYVFSDHRIIPVKAHNEELMEVGVESLRMDPNIIYMTEMRYDEWEFYIFAGEKGFDGLTGTFHTTDAEDIPYQAAMAVFTKRGGELAGHLEQALKSCEIVIIMESADDGRKKVTRVSEIMYDPIEQTVVANDLMRWDKHRDSWTYNANVSAEMLRKMDRKNPAAASKFLAELQKLARSAPMNNPRKESRQSKRVLSMGA